MLLGRLLCLLRRDAGYTQRHAARLAQCTPNYLSMLEHQKTIPSEARLVGLAQVYQCDPKPLLLARAEQMRQQARTLRGQSQALSDTADALRQRSLTLRGQATHLLGSLLALAVFT